MKKPSMQTVPIDFSVFFCFISSSKIVGLVVFSLYVMVLVYKFPQVCLCSGLLFSFRQFFTGCFGVASMFFSTRCAWLYVERATLCK
jgi:hypothetical protein